MADGLTEASDLVVEDETGKDDANSYVSISDADDYADLRQVGALAAWVEANESNKVAALIIATQYVDARWKYVGELMEEDQALAWPRNTSPIYDREGLDVAETLPWQIINATIEYAARAIDPTTFEARELHYDPEVVDDANRFIKSKREKLGPLEEETRYSETRASSKHRNYGRADDIIRNSGLLTATGERTLRS